MQKSLDAVIRGYEACNECNCRGCPYSTGRMIDDRGRCLCDPDDKDEDALYYLREYRDQKNELEKEIAYYRQTTDSMLKTLGKLTVAVDNS